ncbi:NUMOD4 domain-containing protein [Psychrobacillus sp. FSL H8-0483]|uniref:NUMOD4 domain-containing protein n=1 Tax=Psychrobacillus sp. FSL H8-0483 TaxID=2921389 RepID=UPI00315AC9D8
MDFQEERRAIQGYEGYYEITRTGRIFTLKSNRALSRCNDEYGFHIVKLTKNGESKNHNLYELWKSEFPKLDNSEFKGSLKIKYSTGCKLLKTIGIHF